MMALITRLLSLVLAAGVSTSALAVNGDWGQVAQALGKSGSEMPNGATALAFRAPISRSCSMAWS
jgi:hypothetical protein